jgi:hypothetical protein
MGGPLPFGPSALGTRHISDWAGAVVRGIEYSSESGLCPTTGAAGLWLQNRMIDELPSIR